jgi:A/G-specific adenine glycosylase
MPADTLPAPQARQRFRRRLLAWYRAHGRDLPWRNTDDPYHILVSEVMLQQTQVDRVLPKYHEWLGKYPSFEALALAPIDDVTETWRPLGYNIRPRRLHAIACESVSRYGGRLPSDEATLLSFKGIGLYTAGAIRSFAFRQRAAILDTNVARVLYRVFIAEGDPKAHAMKRQLWALSEALVPHKHVFDFNQALMDFGATQCPARAPQCGTCPMRRFCQSYRSLSRPPVKKKGTAAAAKGRTSKPAAPRKAAGAKKAAAAAPTRAASRTRRRAKAETR